MDEKTRRDLNAAGRDTAERLGMLDTVLPGVHYDRAGVPIGLGDWAVLFEDWDYRLVAETMIGEHRVSTVWLGINHAFLGPPQIFETMVSNEGATDLSWWELQDRYSTEDDARAGHERVVEHVETVTGLVRTR